MIGWFDVAGVQVRPVKYANIGYREGRLYREGGSRGGLVNSFTARGENLPTGRIVTRAEDAGGRNGRS
jgi:hypothetical protein